MAVQSDFVAAINQIAAERGIDSEEVLGAVSNAIALGFRQNYPEESNVQIEVKIDQDAGQISVVAVKNVVAEVIDKDIEISLAEAEELVDDVEVGDQLEIDITPEGDFGRVAAQAARNAIMQQVRSVEKETQIKQFEDRLGEIEYAVVQRMDGENVIWEVGRAIAIMPSEDRIPGEFYKSGSRHKVLLKEIEETERGKNLIISRGSNDFLKALFELEVPELGSESVEIKKIAREAGSRSKVAVTSHVDGIDPIGSFVGQKGIRINAVMNELKFGMREEKIDIIPWDENEVQFIANAISPAEVIEVIILNDGENGEERHAKIIVPQDKLSLAIGREGQNVRLAAKLTGWKLDIESDEGELVSASEAESGEISLEAGSSADVPDENNDDESSTESNSQPISTDAQSADSLENLSLSTKVLNSLLAAGINSISDLRELEGNYESISGVGPKAQAEIAKSLAKHDDNN